MSSAGPRVEKESATGIETHARIFHICMLGFGAIRMRLGRVFFHFSWPPLWILRGIGSAASDLHRPRAHVFTTSASTHFTLEFYFRIDGGGELSSLGVAYTFSWAMICFGSIVPFFFFLQIYSLETYVIKTILLYLGDFFL